jgi:DNA-formamidopyrimidine glycosylase
MPEGPEVRRMADSLQARIAGKSILRFNITDKSRYFKTGMAQFEELKLPLDIRKIGSRGKRIIFYCSYLDSRTQVETPVWLVSFLGMEGRWQFVPGSHSGIQISIGHSIYSKPILRVRELTLYFNDQRHFGSLIICLNLEQFETAFAKIGPDLLNDPITLENYIAVARQKSLVNKEVVWFLMEQKYFSGVGNYLKAEILYHSQIHPSRKMVELTDADLEKLYTSTLSIINESYLHGGLTIATYADANGVVGRYERKIYNKDFDPLGNPIVRHQFSDKRTTHWVPSIQI